MNSKHMKQVNRKKNRMIHDGVPGSGKIDFKSWRVLKIRQSVTGYSGGARSEKEREKGNERSLSTGPERAWLQTGIV